MKITPFQAHQITRVLRIVAVHGMARVRDLYIEAGTPADFEGIHCVILMISNDLKLLQLTEDGAIARITIRGILASKIGIITYLSVVIIMKVIVGLAILSAIVSVLIQVFC